MSGKSNRDESDLRDNRRRRRSLAGERAASDSVAGSQVEPKTAQVLETGGGIVPSARAAENHQPESQSQSQTQAQTQLQLQRRQLQHRQHGVRSRGHAGRASAEGGHQAAQCTCAAARVGSKAAAPLPEETHEEQARNASAGAAKGKAAVAPPDCSRPRLASDAATAAAVTTQHHAKPFRRIEPELLQPMQPSGRRLLAKSAAAAASSKALAHTTQAALATAPATLNKAKSSNSNSNTKAASYSSLSSAASLSIPITSQKQLHSHKPNHSSLGIRHHHYNNTININNSASKLAKPNLFNQKAKDYITHKHHHTTSTTLSASGLSSSSKEILNNNKMADQAVIDKLEAGFAKLQAATPEQCHSLLKKYLTREVLDKVKARKTAMGATLLDVAQSGFENLDSGVGIYAPDAESYTLFSELFNPIIQDYHGGFKPTDKHPASDFGDLSTLVNVDPTNEYVISTRVRCGRSLQGYPFNPCLTEAQYKEMETKVTSAFKEMEGDLAGTYYPLTGMTKETQQQLIDDHFLFKEGDRFLQAANACRYWPTGRGIYHNAAKTFLVWVNEEDHLRIISMQKGGDLKEVFGRLVKGARAIEAKVPFSRDDRLGFLTFCPTNLGTTIRASVHIKLPKLAADRKKLEEVAGRYNLQVRGTSGEHTESIGGIYDISNKRRLGLTEYQAVREMQDGILELIKIEKSL